MSRDTDPIQELQDIIASLKFYVEQEQELGFEYLQGSSELPAQRVSPQAGQTLFLEGSSQAPEAEPGDPRLHMDMASLRQDALRCERCPLHRTRRTVVFGTGNENADLVFVGEAPGVEEDRRGQPFVGRAGMLLTNIIRAIKLNREDVYILNVLKCRPPGNRNPQPFEIEQCRPFLQRQIECIRPRVICALGTFAAQTLLNTTEPISRLRGHFHDYRGIPLMPTYHPAFLLRNPARKREVWEDVQKIQALLQER